MASSCRYFEEDCVYRINKKGEPEYGLVLKNWEHSSSDDSSSSSDEEFILKRGQVRVAWHPKGNVQVIPEKKLKLADRSLMPGDVVRYISAKDGPSGYCRSLTIKADVQIVETDSKIENVSSKDLMPLQAFCVDCVITLGPWVGVIKETNLELILVCGDGSRLSMPGTSALDKLEDVKEQRDEDSEFANEDFYVGQQLGGCVSDFEDARWICVTSEMEATRKKPKAKLVVVVEEVKLVSVEVHWYCRSFCEDNRNLIDVVPPSYVIEGSDLERMKLVSSFETCRLQLGDRCYYVVNREDIANSSEKAKVLANLPSKLPNASLNLVVKNEKCDEADAEDENEDSSKPGESSATVEFGEHIKPAESSGKQSNKQCETPEVNLAKLDLEDEVKPLRQTKTTTKEGEKSLKSLRKLSNSAKARRGKNKTRKPKQASYSNLQLKPGSKVCVEVTKVKTLVEIVWQDGKVTQNVSSTDLYPILHLDDHEFFPGDFVSEVKNESDIEFGVVQKVDFRGRMADIQWMSFTTGFGKAPKVVRKSTVSVYDIKDHQVLSAYRTGECAVCIVDLPHLSGCCAGQIIDNQPNGQLLMSWTNGTTCACWPQDVYIITEDSVIPFDEESEDSWETESEKSVSDNEEVFPAGDSCFNAEPLERVELTDVNRQLAIARDFLKGGEYNDNVPEKIFDIYRKCCYMDRALKTHFFDKNIFERQIRELKLLMHRNLTSRFVQNLQDVLKTANNSHPKDSSQEEEVDTTTENLNVTGSDDASCIGAASVNDCQSGDSQNTPILKKELSDEVKQSGKTGTVIDNTGTDYKQISALLVLLEGQLLLMRDEVNRRSADEFTQTPDARATNKRADSENVPLERGSQHEEYSILETTPDSHRFKNSISQPFNRKSFLAAVKNESTLFCNLPNGIIMKGFEDRIDLFSAMIVGPAKTPYEDGLFFFDIRLSDSYPSRPPLFHYISYTADRLNPNLYEDGTVCVSLLGTWSGKGTEMWTKSSNLLQVLLSIQGLILVAEPYYNEAGYEKQMGTQQGKESSRMYNEMVVLKMVQSVTKMVQNPPEVFHKEFSDHLKQNAHSLIRRWENWLEIAKNSANPSSDSSPSVVDKESGCVDEDAAVDSLHPGFPLIPASRGFCITFERNLTELKECLCKANFSCDISN